MKPSPDFPSGAFERVDEGDDDVFYAPPRLVTHIDEQAIAAVESHYGETLLPGSSILDLMSSWLSHLPDDMEFADAVGYGMNAEELAENPRLTCGFVQNLNRDAGLRWTRNCSTRRYAASESRTCKSRSRS